MRAQFWSPARGDEAEAGGDPGALEGGDGKGMFYVEREGAKRACFMCEKMSRASGTVEVNEKGSQTSAFKPTEIAKR